MSFFERDTKISVANQIYSEWFIVQDANYYVLFDIGNMEDLGKTRKTYMRSSFCLFYNFSIVDIACFRSTYINEKYNNGSRPWK